MVYYLKLNRLIDYSIRNLQVWVDVISKMPNSEVIILCDNENLIKRIKLEVDFKELEPVYLKSIKLKEHYALIESISVPRWYNAAYAHLTTFIHAKENQIKKFWNIDADDTVICLDAKRTCELLNSVEQKAEQENISLFSLDMWRSRTYGKHWSFGITYTDGNVDWIDVMKQHQDCRGGRFFKNGNHLQNIDEFFTYLKAVEKGVKIETFYVENLLFIHYSDDFIMNPIKSGVYKWKDGMVLYPILLYLYGVKSLGQIPIIEDAYKIDIGIEDNECTFFLAKMSPFSIETINVIESEEFEEERTNAIRRQIIKNMEKWNFKKIFKEKKVIIFGAGNFTKLLIQLLKDEGIIVDCVLDNAEHKEGINIEGVYVKSPQILLDMNLRNVEILIDVNHIEAIKQQLWELGYIKEPYIMFDYTKIE